MDSAGPEQAAADVAKDAAEAKFEAKVRRSYRALTDEAQEDSYVDLMRALRDTRAAFSQRGVEIKRLNELVKSFEGDQAEVIRRLARDIEHKRSEVFRANDKTAAVLRQVYALKKRVKELEEMGIPI